MADRIAEVLEVQSGVVSRQQMLAAGFASHDIRRMVRRRELAPVHDGVYVDHTGTPTWIQRAWAAVLFAAPAALTHESAIRAVDGPGRHGGDAGPIQVAIDRGRTAVAPDGVRIHHLSHLQSRTQWNACPPRVRLEHALLDVAARAATDFKAIATLADGVQSRRTTGPRLADALAGRSRIPRRAFLLGVIGDITDGACSTLEHGYLERVERPHGLPVAHRQSRASARGPIYRDVDYEPIPLLVELDGRLFHDNATAHDRDLDRDLIATVDGHTTARVGWGQVFDRPCTTAELVGILLTQRGWTGTFTRCPSCP